jgi:hypothetical protein
VADGQCSGDCTADNGVVATGGNACGDGRDPFRHFAFGRGLQIEAAQMSGGRD